MKAKRPKIVAPNERAELARQGAKSAARGEPASENPMDRVENSPPVTGESSDEWRQRRDAWRAGHDSQAAVTRDVHPPAAHGRDDEHD